ncbi:hypothetical protein C4D13_RS14105 [Vibrio parahaemolyticus]|nr:hypothetical protein [Vibrio parahaemolyticus]EJG0472061.1 hypothetical protein [Vibrio parahaemolyticus]
MKNLSNDVTFASKEAANSFADNLSSVLKQDHSISLKPIKLLHATAKCLGYKNWNHWCGSAFSSKSDLMYLSGDNGDDEFFVSHEERTPIQFLDESCIDEVRANDSEIAYLCGSKVLSTLEKAIEHMRPDDEYDFHIENYGGVIHSFVVAKRFMMTHEEIAERAKLSILSQLKREPDSYELKKQSQLDYFGVYDNPRLNTLYYRLDNAIGAFFNEELEHSIGFHYFSPVEQFAYFDSEGNHKVMDRDELMDFLSSIEGNIPVLAGVYRPLFG